MGMTIDYKKKYLKYKEKYLNFGNKMYGGADAEPPPTVPPADEPAADAEEQAATKLQAFYRGNKVRQKARINTLLKYLKEKSIFIYEIKEIEETIKYNSDY